MEVKPGYKMTEVGVIPEDWEVSKIGNLGTVVRGGSPRPAGDPRYFNGNFIPWLTVAALTNISENQLNVLETFGFLTEEGVMFSRVLERDTLIIANSGATLGVAKLLRLRCCANDGIAAIVEQKKGSKEFVCFYINSKTAFLREVVATGNGQPNLNTALIREIPIPFPPITEQAAIASALSDVDALIESLEQLIAKKRNIKQGAMQELLTGKRRLPGFSGEWEVKRLGDILSRLANGAVYRPTNSFGLPITRIETIANGGIDLSKIAFAEANTDMESYKMVAGDILYSHINSLDHIGKVAQYSGGNDLYHGMNLLLFRVNEHADSRFLFFWFTSSAARRVARNLAKQAVSQASINTKELKMLETVFPPVPEQTAIAIVLSDMDAELSSLESKLSKARHLKQAMMQELLTGRIRLV